MNELKSSFRTPIIIEASSFSIDYKTKIMLMGSCFADNIGDLLQRHKFNTMPNPFGVVYNPVSICNNLIEIIDGKSFKETDISESNGIFFTYRFHSKMSELSLGSCLNKINAELEESREFLKTTDLLILSLGSAWVYELEESGQLVANCHKQPSKNFRKRLLGLDEIGLAYANLFEKLKSFNPSLKILFTVSPVRHWKDGPHENNLSKSLLHLSVHKALKKKQIEYFPSYEIQMDELRDYRFYSDDMLHPSKQAVEYIYSRFQEALMNNDTVTSLKRIEKIKRALEHRPFNDSGSQYEKFVQNTITEIEKIAAEMPWLNFEKELKQIRL